jgi:hypothetical protein
MFAALTALAARHPVVRSIVSARNGDRMTVASALLQRHIETLLSPGEWETLIADDILWELPFAPALGHPGRLEGREAVETHVKWFRGAVENFRFSDIRIYPLADPDGVAQATVAGAEPLPVPKQGSCPSSYRESGGFCMPISERAPAAIPKVGVCPGNWYDGAWELVSR